MRHFRKIYLLIGLSIALSVNAHAYLDPSVMTYAIQVVAGVVVAVGAVVSIYLRKIKRKMKDKLGVDVNAKKEIEEDVVEIIYDEKKEP